MKGFLCLFFGFCLFFAGINLANAQTNDKTIKFIYINGSNANDEKAKESYLKNVRKLHKHMKAVLEKDLFKNGEYSINEKEDVLFWGFNSKLELDVIKNNLAEIKRTSPIFAQCVRNLLAHCMHDAIWVQKEVNMTKIINQLHRNVTAAHANNEKVILLGHSAGSFVTYNYMQHKLKNLNVDYFSGKKDGKFTCVDAFVQSGLGVKLATDRLKKNPNDKQFLEAYNKIDEYTEQLCIPDGTLVGVINFGSPLSLFYSNQISRSVNESSAYSWYFLKYLQENNIFFLTVNFADDPLGFPVDRNVSKSDIEMEFGTTLSNSGKGFVYNYSKRRSSGMFATAHSGYFTHSKKFAKTVLEAYKKGYNNFYSQYD